MGDARRRVWPDGPDGLWVYLDPKFTGGAEVATLEKSVGLGEILRALGLSAGLREAVEAELRRIALEGAGSAIREELGEEAYAQGAEVGRTGMFRGHKMVDLTREDLYVVIAQLGLSVQRERMQAASQAMARPQGGPPGPKIVRPS